MRLRYDNELDEALAWSGWFCRVSTATRIEMGRQYWAVWQRIVDADRRAFLVEGDGEDLLADYRFWRDAEPNFPLANTHPYTESVPPKDLVAFDQNLSFMEELGEAGPKIRSLTRQAVVCRSVRRLA
jgi:hypothetical protein